MNPFTEIPVIEPMKAVSGRVPADSSGWAQEVKWDGVRALLTIVEGDARVTGSSARDMTGLFPEVIPIADGTELEGSVLDGEMVVFGADGKPSFSGIQRRLGRRAAPRTASAVLVLFDLLFHNGEDLRDLPWSERRERLDGLELGGPAWRTPGYFTGDVAAMLAATAEQGLEGIVIKRMDSPYRSGRRSRSWLKLKNGRRQEFVIGGWFPGRGGRGGSIGSLLLGYRDSTGVGGPLRYAGRVGSGLGERELEEVGGLLAGLERAESPFAGPVTPRAARFVEPELVGEVRFAEWTPDGHLRHPVWLGLRRDSDPVDVVREEVR
jgi:bifunctional non-homologous end joining protein LigD